jgi:stage II sporulation protein E
MQEDADDETALEDRCPRFGALKTQIGQSYIDFVSGLAAKEKLRELRGVVTDQFDTLADFLEEVASLVRGSRVVDSNRSRTLRTALADAGQYVDALHYFTDPSGRASVEITMLEDAFSLDFGLIRKKLETLTGRQFAPEEIAILDLRTVVTFWERAAFRVLCGRAQIPLAASGVSGDCVGTLQDPGGRSVALLSDGMGTGARAAVDSVLTATLLEKLLKSGFAFPGALKLVNCALLVKSSDESIATADGLVVNVYTGQADLYKAGAAASFWRQGDRVTQIEAPSLPIGILRKVGLAHRTLQLAAGDIVLLVSDGVTAQDCGWLNDELLAWSTNNMDDLASHIASLAKLRSDEETRDDITVVAVKLLENRG